MLVRHADGLKMNVRIETGRKSLRKLLKKMLPIPQKPFQQLNFLPGYLHLPMQCRMVM
jgi:hypothetical protein